MSAVHRSRSRRWGRKVPSRHRESSPCIAEREVGRRSARARAGGDVAIHRKLAERFFHHIVFAVDECVILVAIPNIVGDEALEHEFEVVYRGFAFGFVFGFHVLFGRLGLNAGNELGGNFNVIL